MLTTNAKLDVGTGLFAQIRSHLDQLTYADLIQFCKGSFS